MKSEIARLAEGRPRTQHEREIRDLEVEARTFARVLRAAEKVAMAVDDPRKADGLRTLVAEFFDPDELPRPLQPAAAAESHARLVGRATNARSRRRA